MRDRAFVCTEKRAKHGTKYYNKTGLKASTFSAFRDVWIVFRHSCLKYVRICRCVLASLCHLCTSRGIFDKKWKGGEQRSDF